MTAAELRVDELNAVLKEVALLNQALATRLQNQTQALKSASTRMEALSQRLVSEQEQERRRIAEWLHDDVGQMLTALTMVLARGEESPGQFAEAKSLVGILLERVRSMSMNLRPHVLDQFGLKRALEWHVGEFSALTRISVRLSVRRIPLELDSTLALTTFRIVQEGLTNIARYAKASVAIITVSKHDNRLEIEVRDNGSGFNPQRVRKTSWGLNHLRERIWLSGGEFLVESQRGQGTALKAILPLTQFK